MAIAALVVAIVALLGVVGVGVFAASTVFGGSAEPLTGRAPVSSGAPLPGSALADAVSTRISDDGGTVGRLTCPDTKTVTQGIVTVCHATVDEADWAVIVFFEDADGSFTLDLI